MLYPREPLEDGLHFASILVQVGLLCGVVPELFLPFAGEPLCLGNRFDVVAHACQELFHHLEHLFLVHLFFVLLELLYLQQRGLHLEHDLAHCRLWLWLHSHPDLLRRPRGPGPLPAPCCTGPGPWPGPGGDLPEPPQQHGGAVVQVRLRGLLGARLRRVVDLLRDPQGLVDHHLVPGPEAVLEDPDNDHGVVLGAPGHLPGPDRRPRKHTATEPELGWVVQHSHHLVHEFQLLQQVFRGFNLHGTPEEPQGRVLLLFFRQAGLLGLLLLLALALLRLNLGLQVLVLLERPRHALTKQVLQLIHVTLVQVRKESALVRGILQDLGTVVKLANALKEGLGFRIAESTGAALPLRDAVNRVLDHPDLPVRGLALLLPSGLGLALLLGRGFRESLLRDLLLCIGLGRRHPSCPWKVELHFHFLLRALRLWNQALPEGLVVFSV
mmetsp:Transcript_6902/g.20161  ORF Transcript_6902/g.20161 Transcript_6902/m.20161 type:complete len:440 (-) Transcript_6902:1710-3029(-)